MVKKA